MTSNKILTILLAEDDEDDSEILRQFLAELYPGINLIIVENGVLVMDYLKQNASMPDAIFLDLNMPLKNGIECLTEIKGDDKYKEVVTIILTTSSDPNQKSNCYELGADLFLTKPSNYTHFKAIIMTALDKIIA